MASDAPVDASDKKPPPSKDETPALTANQPADGKETQTEAKTGSSTEAQAGTQTASLPPKRRLDEDGGGGGPLLEQPNKAQKLAPASEDNSVDTVIKTIQKPIQITPAKILPLPQPHENSTKTTTTTGAILASPEPATTATAATPKTTNDYNPVDVISKIDGLIRARTFHNVITAAKHRDVPIDFVQVVCDEGGGFIGGRWYSYTRQTPPSASLFPNKNFSVTVLRHIPESFASQPSPETMTPLIELKCKNSQKTLVCFPSTQRTAAALNLSIAQVIRAGQSYETHHQYDFTLFTLCYNTHSTAYLFGTDVADYIQTIESHHTIMTRWRKLAASRKEQLQLKQAGEIIGTYLNQRQNADVTTGKGSPATAAASPTPKTSTKPPPTASPPDMTSTVAATSVRSPVTPAQVPLAMPPASLILLPRPPMLAIPPALPAPTKIQLQPALAVPTKTPIQPRSPMPQMLAIAPAPPIPVLPIQQTIKFAEAAAKAAVATHVQVKEKLDPRAKLRETEPKVFPPARPAKGDIPNDIFKPDFHQPNMAVYYNTGPPTSCILCQKRPPNTVLYPCGHASLCKKCSDGKQFCPQCRSTITKIEVATDINVNPVRAYSIFSLLDL